MRAREFVTEATFAGQEVKGNAYVDLKDKFPLLSTLIYFIPGLTQALAVADAASAIQMYNQAMEKIEQQYSVATIQAVQQKAGDADEPWEPMITPLDELSFLGSPCTKDCSGHRAGYAWSQARGNRTAMSHSNSFNNGARLASQGK
jgi:hypothetical protein